MKLALVQINTTVGDVAGNTRKILRGIEEGRALGADLAIFHEMAIIGYPPRDLLELPWLISRVEESLTTIARAAHGIAVVVGTVERNRAGGGKKLFNSAVWCEEGEIKAVARKSLLPTYDVFDESRYFEPGRETTVVDFKGKRFGLTVCEDIWNEAEFGGRKLYERDPVSDLVGEGAQVILNLSASPYAMGKFGERLKIVAHQAMRHRIPVAYVNQVGGNDQLIFDGGSMVVGPTGEIQERAPFFRETVQIVELSGVVRETLPIPNDIALLEEALILGLKDYVRKCGFKKVALGLSGGIDSALVAALAVRAVGPRNVLGLIMPSRFSSRESRKDALALAKNLKIAVREVDIRTLHKTYEGAFRKLFGRKKSDTTEENIQARIRGNLLMAVSNKLGHLVLSTGNKSELAVGYCTLYGDMSGGLAVISDLPKTLVYELARQINSRRKVIPEAIFLKAPTAELKPNQTDQDTLPPYDQLDAILKLYVEEMKSYEEIVGKGFDPKIVRDTIERVQRSEYKRWQAAPGLRVTSKAFGMGRRFPIACKT